MEAWYLLYCKTRGEARAQQNLALQKIKSYLPSYLFIKFDPKKISVSQINSTRGAVSIVGSKELMMPIDESVISAIRKQEKDMNLLVIGNDINSPCCDLIEEKEIFPGDRVRVTEGVFSSIEGVFQEKSGDKRCHVLFELMGQLKKVRIPLSMVKSA